MKVMVSGTELTQTDEGTKLRLLLRCAADFGGNIIEDGVYSWVNPTHALVLQKRISGYLEKHQGAVSWRFEGGGLTFIAARDDLETLSTIPVLDDATTSSLSQIATRLSEMASVQVKGGDLAALQDSLDSSRQFAEIHAVLSTLLTLVVGYVRK